MMKSIFIDNAGLSNGWIVSILGNDIKNALEDLGYSCRIGSRNEYQGEDVYYNLIFSTAVPNKEAKHNSVFITHFDDRLKECDITKIKDDFDSFICMSQEDAFLLIELGFDKKKVFGLTLPVRNQYIRPLTIGIFSACYPDNRKNEKWLIEYCSQKAIAQLAIFVFIGKGWGGVVKELDGLNCSAEWINISRKLPYEYEYQQNKLSLIDYYIYMGMDGGAMGTYDAYAQGVPLCVTFDGFHKSIPNIEYQFDNKEGFFKQLDVIIGRHQEKLNFFRNNTSVNYAKEIASIWSGEGFGVDDYPVSSAKCLSYETILGKKRDNYLPITFGRFFGILMRKLSRRKRTIEEGVK